MCWRVAFISRLVSEGLSVRNSRNNARALFQSGFSFSNSSTKSSARSLTLTSDLGNNIRAGHSHSS